MTSPSKSALYVYNAENRLVRATVQSGNNVSVEEYKYDYAGNRIAKSYEDEYTKYLLDINGELTYVLAEMNFDNTEKCYYTRGDELISQERDGKKSYYVYDGHGSVVGLANESGVVTDTYAYDAFGNLISSTGSTENNYRYCGEQFDETTGLYYLRARYMDTSTGRFISQDTYQGDINDPISLHKYLYANANPVMYSDPSGYIGLLDTVCASTIGNVLFYSASAGLITFGMGLIRQLREIDSGVRKTIDWSNLIKEIIFSTALAAGLSCVCFLILPLITNMLAKAIVCYVLSGTGMVFAGLGVFSAYSDFKSKNYDLVVIDLFLALCSIYGSYQGIKQGHCLISQHITSRNISSMPSNVQQSYKNYVKSGWKNHSGQTPGTKAGKSYKNYPSKNSGKVLPSVDSNGNPITYKEYDVNNYVPPTRDAERFIVGSDGSVYYTDSNYGDKPSSNGNPDFIKIIP